VRVPKLNDANWAGTKDLPVHPVSSRRATRSEQRSGGPVGRRDAFGVSLRGKLLNVRDATVGKVADNEEITNVKKTRPGVRQDVRRSGRPPLWREC
jgi:hypothetical protein